jgi:hypothetical protein
MHIKIIVLKVVIHRQLKQPVQVGDFGAKKNLRLFPGMKKTNLQFFNQNLHIYDIAICVPNLMIFFNL